VGGEGSIAYILPLEGALRKEGEEKRRKEAFPLPYTFRKRKGGGGEEAKDVEQEHEGGRGKIGGGMREVKKGTITSVGKKRQTSHLHYGENKEKGGQGLPWKRGRKGRAFSFFLFGE